MKQKSRITFYIKREDFVSYARRYSLVIGCLYICTGLFAAGMHLYMYTDIVNIYKGMDAMVPQAVYLGPYLTVTLGVVMVIAGVLHLYRLIVPHYWEDKLKKYKHHSMLDCREALDMQLDRTFLLVTLVLLILSFMLFIFWPLVQFGDLLK